jgi:hypothetical protein
MFVVERLWLLRGCVPLRVGCLLLRDRPLLRGFPLRHRMNDLRSGALVGTDKFGNEYYENNEHIYGKPMSVMT